MTEETLFTAALGKRTPAERAAFLDEACSGDVALRQRVEALLQSHAEAGTFLETPAVRRAAEELGGRACGESTLGEPPREEDGDSLDFLAPSPKPGSLGRLGHFEVLAVIGRGAMGVVLKAFDEELRRVVAIKVLAPQLATNATARKRFVREAQAAAAVRDEHVIGVHATGEANGLPYLAMEYVAGLSLQERLDRGGPLGLKEVLRIGVQAAAGLAAAHAQGLIHRDVKPSNLLLENGVGRVKITDFGLARAVDDVSLTQSGLIAGTPKYMAPEQARGAAVDHRADVYALGATLYELLTGRPAFDGSDIQSVLRQVATDEPPRPRRLNRAIPAELETIVLKAMEKDPADRYATARELADDLERFLKYEPIRAKPPTPVQRARKWVRRHQPVVWSAVVATAAVLLLAVGMLALSYLRISEEQQVTAKALGQAREAEREKTDKLWLSHYERARAGRFSRHMGQRLDSLDALAQAARIRPDDRLRDEAIAALALPDIRRGPSWHAGPPGSKTFDGRYRQYARADNKGVISVRTIPDDREVRRITSGATTLSGLWLSPDGRFLARLEEGYALRVWRVADGRPVLREEPRQTRGWAFSPDSRHLAVGRQGWVLRFEMATGKEVNRWRLPAAAHGLEFHPDNRQLAVGYHTSTIASVYDATNGKLVANLPVGSINEQVVAWHPDGERLAVAGSDPRIQVWDVAAKRKLATLEGHAQHVTHLTFHPGGGLLASTSWDGVLRLWDPSSGRQLMQIPVSSHAGYSSDGRYLGLAVHGEQAQLLEVTPSREYRTFGSSLGAGQGGYYDGDISPDGSLLAVAMGGDGTRLWDLHRGRELAVLPGGTRSVFFDRIGPRWELLTAGSAGLLRWPAKREDPAGGISNPSPTRSNPDGGAIRPTVLGPPRRLRLSPLGRVAFARSPEGRTLAVVSEGEGNIQVLDLGRGVVRQKLWGRLRGTDNHALSADGRWAANCGWHSDRVRLWNVQTGKMVREWVLGPRNAVFFTPDSRTLIISRGDEFSFWDVESLRPVRRLRRDVALYPGWVAFSPDGRLMALEMAPAIIHLKEVATGRTVARLEDPHGDRAGWLGFTPDGTRLVTVANYAHAIHVWDLRLIREQLKTMDLDWDWPEFAPADPPGKAAPPLKVRVVPGDLATSALTREHKARRDIACYRRAVEAKPDDAKACNNLAWVYLTAPEALRDVKAALPLAEKAVRLEPGNAVYGNTLGVAYYRAGRYHEAVKVLRRNLDGQEDWGLAFDLYFLAMSHHRLGETARARDYYDWAVRWMGTQKGLPAGHLEELTVFRAEAADLLGINKKKE
jgi:eukaryotic-like serine/threonine-protein kinase